MALSIKISKKVGGRSDMIASRSWPQSRISIGRGEECTLVLEDPKKHVSRVHVELEEMREGKYQLIVVSKVNPVFVNGKKRSPGSTHELNAGDRIELGEYELELLVPSTLTQRPAVPTLDVEETTRPDNPMLQVPKEMLVDAPPAAAPPAPAPVKQETTQPVAPVARVPEPVEVFPEAALKPEELPPIEPGIFDEPAVPEAPAATPAPPAPPASAAKSDADVFGEATFIGAPGALPGNILDEATYLGSRPVPAAPGDAGGAREALKAFLEGAGMQGKGVSDAELEAFMRQSGKILRAAVEGTMALLAARATAKKELRAEDRTMVASKDNNPLKLMSDPNEALAFLLDTRDRAGGFLEPVQAVGDAFEDLRAHEVALFAGMRAALLGAIQRFDPKMLETELEKRAGGLGLNRKAKLWEQFAAYQQKLARDAEDDFNKVFGREFMGTYMAQVKRLRSGNS